MINYDQAGVILSEMVRTGRTFRVAGQRSAEGSLAGTRLGFLQHLSHCDARLGELAYKLSVSAPVASRAVDSLEEDALAERRTDPDDARAFLISITDRGREKLAEAHADAVHRFADALSDWSTEDAERAIGILHTLNTHLGTVVGAPSPVQAEKHTKESEIHE